MGDAWGAELDAKDEETTEGATVPGAWRQVRRGRGRGRALASVAG
jgi:hypothetical protein